MKRYLILFLLMFVMVGTTSAGDPKSPRKKSSIRPVACYSMSSCDDCAALKKYLRRKGVQLSIVHVESTAASAYPTVVYSNNTSDYGERVLKGRCSLPGSLKVWEID